MNDAEFAAKQYGLAVLLSHKKLSEVAFRRGRPWWAFWRQREVVTWGDLILGYSRDQAIAQLRDELGLTSDG